MQVGTALAVYGAIVLVMSVVSFITYWFDKRQAGLGRRRVSERQLLTMGFLGGWPGALLAQKRFRHKTQKVSFRVKFWLLVVAHLCLVAVIGYVLLKG
jgi:uncharacterized membrane protein YsdA (DUF1294 family)